MNEKENLEKKQFQQANRNYCQQQILGKRGQLRLYGKKENLENMNEVWNVRKNGIQGDEGILIRVNCDDKDNKLVLACVF